MRHRIAFRSGSHTGAGSTRWGRVLRLLTLPAALLLSGALVWGGSYAAFTSTTATGANSWNTATVALTDDDGGGSAMFNIDRVVPGFRHAACITVVSQSSVNTRLKMYGEPLVVSELAASLVVTVEEGSSSTADGRPINADPHCKDFVSAEVIFDQPIYAFPPAGISSSQDEGGYLLPAGGTRSYRITFSLPPEFNDRALEGTTITGNFAWEAQSRPNS